MQRVERGVDRTGTGKGTIVIPLGPTRAAMLLDARISVIRPQENEREAFVVTQQHVVRWPVALDKLRLEQQSFRLAIGRDDGHAARLRDHAAQAVGQPLHLRVVRHPVLERLRLADIEHIAARIIHAIDARLGRQSLEHIADGCNARLQVRLIGGPAHRIGCALLIESIRRIGRGHIRRLRSTCVGIRSNWGDNICNWRARPYC